MLSVCKYQECILGRNKNYKELICESRNFEPHASYGKGRKGKGNWPRRSISGAKDLFGHRWHASNSGIPRVLCRKYQFRNELLVPSNRVPQFAANEARHRACIRSFFFSEEHEYLFIRVDKIKSLKKRLQWSKIGGFLLSVISNHLFFFFFRFFFSSQTYCALDWRKIFWHDDLLFVKYFLYPMYCKIKSEDF